MKKLSIILSVLIIIGCVGYIAYDKVTDFLVKKTLMMVAEDDALKGEIEKALENLAGGENQTTNTPEQTPPAEETPQSASSQKVPVDEKGRPAKIFPTAPPKTPAPSKKDGTLSLDDLQGADKTYVMGIYNRFSAAEVSKVSGMISGGITAEEKRAIKAIVYAKVTSAEISKLYEIAKKYQ